MSSEVTSMSSSFDTTTSAGNGAASGFIGVEGDSRAGGDRRSATAHGGYIVDPRALDALVTRRLAPPRPTLPVLTRREHGILAELATGRSNAAIAERLGLSERTVEKYINAVFSKLDLGDDGAWNRRVKAALLFLGANPG